MVRNEPTITTPPTALEGPFTQIQIQFSLFPAHSTSWAPVRTTALDREVCSFLSDIMSLISSFFPYSSQADLQLSYFQMNCLRRQTCHSLSIPMLLCLTKWHNATEVHFHHTDLPQEVPGMNHKTSWVPTEPYQLQVGTFQQGFNSQLLSHKLLFGLSYLTLGKQILPSVTNQTLSLC